MTREELLSELRRLSSLGGLSEGADVQDNHERADAALLDYIDDEEIRAVFEEIEKWYD